MRHYEVVFLVHPDQSEQVPGMIERYTQLMADNGGKVHRTEDWGRRQLAYPINKIHKAHYVLMNIECRGETFEELSSLFRFNDAVLRNLMIKCKDTITEESLILKGERETKERKARSEAKRKVEEEAAAESGTPSGEAAEGTAEGTIATEEGKEKSTKAPEDKAKTTSNDKVKPLNKEKEQKKSKKKEEVEESIIAGLNKSSAEYKAGYAAAKKGIKYDANPHAPGIKGMNWQTGHNDFRADKLRKAGKPNYGARGQFEELEEGTWYISRALKKLRNTMKQPMPYDKKGFDFVAKYIGDDELWDDLGALKKGQDMVPAIKKAMKRLGIKEDAPANATGTAVAGTGDDSSTVVVKKKKKLQDKLMRRLKIKEALDRAVPDLQYPKDEITERKQQLIDLAKKYGENI